MGWNDVVNISIWITTVILFVAGFWNLRRMLVGRAMPDEMAELAYRDPPTPRQKFSCWMGNHEWVSRIDLGIQPDKEQVNSSHVVNYFFFFAAPVCKHCPTQLPPRYPDAGRSDFTMEQ